MVPHTSFFESDATDAAYGVIGAAEATAEVEGAKAYSGWFKASASAQLSAEVGIHAEVVDSSSDSTLIEGVAGGAVKFRVDGTEKITTSSNGLVTNLNADTVDGKHAGNFALKFQATRTVDIASVANAACSTTYTQAVTGALMGDSCLASAGIALESGTILSCRVTSADTVTFQLCNLSGVAVDRANDTYTFRVIR